MANKNTKIATTATESLKLLLEEKFFQTWRKSGAIEEYLGKKGYHFSFPELGMALKRAKHLTRKGKQGNYEYVQKHPFTNELKESSKKRR